MFYRYFLPERCTQNLNAAKAKLNEREEYILCLEGPNKIYLFLRKKKTANVETYFQNQLFYNNNLKNKTGKKDKVSLCLENFHNLLFIINKVCKRCNG